VTNHTYDAYQPTPYNGIIHDGTHYGKNYTLPRHANTVTIGPRTTNTFGFTRFQRRGTTTRWHYRSDIYPTLHRPTSFTLLLKEPTSKFNGQLTTLYLTWTRVAYLLTTFQLLDLLLGLTGTTHTTTISKISPFLGLCFWHDHNSYGKRSFCVVSTDPYTRTRTFETSKVDYQTCLLQITRWQTYTVELYNLLTHYPYFLLTRSGVFFLTCYLPNSHLRSGYSLLRVFITLPTPNTSPRCDCSTLTPAYGLHSYFDKHSLLSMVFHEQTLPPFSTYTRRNRSATFL